MSIRTKLTYKHTVFTCYLAYIASASVNNIASLLFVTFQNEFGISTTQLASLVTINFATQILVDLIGARYVDKIGYRIAAIIACCFSSVGLVSLGILPNVMSNTYFALCISAVLYAVGSGLCEVLISPMVAALPGDAKESAMSILHSFYCWGHVLVVVLSTIYFSLTDTEDWFYLPLLWAIVPVITLILFAIVPIKTLNEETPSMPMSQLFRKKLFWLFMLLMICGGAAEVAMAQWASMFAETALGVSKTVGNLLGPCFFAVMMGLARVIYGKFSDKLPMLKALVICGILTVCGYLIVSLVPNPYVSLLGCGIIGFGVGIFWPGVLSVSAKRIPAGGTAMFGILALSGDVGCSTGPQLAAVVSEIAGGSLNVGLLACIVFPIIIVVACSILVKSEKKPEKELSELN